jgi:hypothetical protein
LISTKRLALRDYVDKALVSRVEMRALEDALADECGLLLYSGPNVVLKRQLGVVVEYVLVYTGVLVVARFDKASGRLTGYEVYYGREKIVEGTCR